MGAIGARFWPGLGAFAVSLIAAGLLLALGLSVGLQILLLMVAATVLPFALYLLWQVDPAYTISAAIFLSPVAGNWHQLHFPTGADPDRLLLALGICQVLFRAPAVHDRPPFRFTAAHAFMGAAVLYALASAFTVHVLLSKAPLFKIIDSFGILPFLTFLVAPVAFRTRRQRGILLVTLVALGAYLGLTTLFEVIHLRALVFPRYINNPNFGIHYGRGRGPFVDAVANGFACFVCTAACGVALATWRRPKPRLAAASIGALCFVGSFLSLERSVWIGVTIGSVITMLVMPRLRRYLLPAILTVSIAGAGAFILVPGVNNKFNQRVDNVSSVYDRQNLAVAGLNMVAARPLTGVGWARFQADSLLYFRQSQNYPINPRLTRFGIHNFLLLYAVELGLPGLTLWTLGLLLGIGSALLTRGPPDLDPWRAALLAVFVAFLVVANSVPPSVFPNLSLWLLAGVVFSGRYAERPATPERAKSSALEARPQAPAVATVP
jgi:putative inorganic carbon (hco3(-)) transporter